MDLERIRKSLFLTEAEKQEKFEEERRKSLVRATGFARVNVLGPVLKNPEECSTLEIVKGVYDFSFGDIYTLGLQGQFGISDDEAVGIVREVVNEAREFHLEAKPTGHKLKVCVGQSHHAIGVDMSDETLRLLEGGEEWIESKILWNERRTTTGEGKRSSRHTSGGRSWGNTARKLTIMRKK